MFNSAEAYGRRPVAGRAKNLGPRRWATNSARNKQRAERRVGHADVPGAIRVQQVIPRWTGKVPSEREPVTSCDNTG
jgi:hypothetical protein